MEAVRRRLGLVTLGGDPGPDSSAGPRVSWRARTFEASVIGRSGAVGLVCRR